MFTDVQFFCILPSFNICGFQVFRWHKCLRIRFPHHKLAKSTQEWKKLTNTWLNQWRWNIHFKYSTYNRNGKRIALFHVVFLLSVIGSQLIFQEKAFNLKLESNPGSLSFQASIQTIIPSRFKYKNGLKSLL